jgi:DNA-binding LytR/AlgR family response regulator
MPYAVAFGLLALAGVVNVTSTLHDRHGRLPVWMPVVWEASSVAAVLGTVWIIFGLIDWTARRGLSWRAALPLHGAAACAFSALHCVGMWSLRRVAYTVAGVAYGWTVPLGQVFYEFRKDVLTYAVVALIYQATQRVRVRVPAVATAPVRATFDIRDGARLVRVPVAEIAAVSSAGNYVEFVLTDGRRILMRGTLAGVLAELAPAGFLRVHRSWIVNAAQLRGAVPDGSGDYTLALAGGVEVPLSRRFPEVLRQVA